MDASALYQAVILQHNREPQHVGELPAATHSGHGINPVCGDEVYVSLVHDGSAVRSIGWTGEGCAICRATASMMSAAVMGSTEAEVRRVYAALLDVIRGEHPPTEDLGELSALAGLREYPTRIKCATLPWQTLFAALDNRNEAANTENA